MLLPTDYSPHFGVTSLLNTAMSPLGNSPLESENPLRKKKRVTGSFPCPECSKTFTRADHLSRHFLNHKPKQVYVCEYSLTDHDGRTRGCGKTFVRKDLRERHYRRHLAEKSYTLTKRLVGSGLSQSPNQRIAQAQDSCDNINQFSKAELENQDDASIDLAPPRSSVSAISQFLGSLNSDNQDKKISEISGRAFAAQSSVHNTHNSTGKRALASAPQSSNRLFQVKNVESSVQPQKPQNSMYYTPSALSGASLQREMPRNTSTIPYSEGDIISWLFSDNIEEPDISFHNASMSHLDASYEHGPASPQYYYQIPYLNGYPVPHDFRQQMPSFQKEAHLQSADAIHSQFNLGDPQVSYGQVNAGDPQSNISLISGQQHQDAPGNIKAPWTPFYYPALKNQAFNNGLQDLNCFFNNDNPLEDLLNTYPSESRMKIHNLLPSSISSSSPTHSSESFTPRSIRDASGVDSTQDLFEMHAKTFATVINVGKNKQVFMNTAIFRRMLEQVPSLDEHRIREIFPSVERSTLEDRLSFFLQCYWDTFQPRFSILHRPSFSTDTAEPLLLLAMICVGCLYSGSSVLYANNEQKSPEFKFCMEVIVPLRFTLFQHPNFKSPVRVWILQALNLLEWCEKNHLLREMHERAHIHHGTTVQLLRRSPFLGGNPAVANKVTTPASDTGTSGGEDENSDGVGDLREQVNSDRTLFRKWVDSESMKRITFMTFYLDVIDYVKFRHNPQIPFFQLQLLNLPCDEDQLWNNDEVNGSFQKVVKRQKKLYRSTALLGRGVKDANRIRPGTNFLSALKRILKPRREQVIFSRTSLFIENILIGGLSSLMHLMQQSEFQNSFASLISPTENKRNSAWKDVLMRALDAFELEFFSNSVSTPKSLFPTHLIKCEFPMYHLLQIIGLSDINHYDIAIYGGSPKNMSVDATSKDQQLIQRKLHSIFNSGVWMGSINDLANARSVIHCYWLLWKTMLGPMAENGEPTSQQWAHPWLVEYDYADSMYAISIATLVLWCYTFSTCGPESTKFCKFEDSWSKQDLKSYAKIFDLCEENGYQYLARLRHEFVHLTKRPDSGQLYVLHLKLPSNRTYLLNDALTAHCKTLPALSNKQNIAGLCLLVGSTLVKSQWQIIRENAKLIINCGLRSLGKQNALFPDLFDNEFKN